MISKPLRGRLRRVEAGVAGRENREGYEKIEAGMPVYSGVLNDAQAESLIMFIKTLQ